MYLKNCPIQKGCICDENSTTLSLVQRHRLEQEQLWKQIVDVECVFCISLDERDDRFFASQSEFHRVGLCRLVKFYRVSRPTPAECEQLNIQKRGRYGVWRSHAEVAQRIHQRLSQGSKKQFPQQKVGLVFEDDIVFQSFMTQAIANKILRHLEEQLPTNWQVYKLGQSTSSGYPINLSLDLFRSYSIMMHAYFLSASGAQVLASSSFLDTRDKTGKEMHVDTWMKQNMTVYATRPQLVMQSDSDSSNTNNLHDTRKPKVRFDTTAFWRHFHNTLDIMAYLFTFLIVVSCVGMLVFGMLWICRCYRTPKETLASYDDSQFDFLW